MTYNWLVWENPTNLPIPTKVQNLAKQVKLEELEWQSIGLPESGAKYSLVDGQVLYREQDAAGNTSVQKEEFTGGVLIGTVFFSPEEEKSYLLSYKVIFLKGELKGVELDELLEEDLKEIKKQENELAERLAKDNKRFQSFWYKNLYKPYRFVVRGLAVAAVWLLMVIQLVVRKIAFFLTPL